MTMQLLELTEYPGRGHLWPRNLDDVVDDFIFGYRSAADAEFEGFANEASLEDAITRAARARNLDGKRHWHQRRFAKELLEDVHVVLQGLRLHDEQSFHELFELIEAAILPMHGIGELMVYDTAQRIGARLGLEAEYVYLHRGTRDGAYNLGLDWKKPYLTPDELPPAFRRLKPREIEDCLCIYKKVLRSDW